MYSHLDAYLPQDYHKFHVAYAGQSDGLAVNDLEGLVLAGVEGGEHALVVTDVI